MQREPEQSHQPANVDRRGNVRWGLIALLLGLPIPLVLVAALFVGGCR